MDMIDKLTPEPVGVACLKILHDWHTLQNYSKTFPGTGGTYPSYFFIQVPTGRTDAPDNRLLFFAVVFLFAVKPLGNIQGSHRQQALIA